MTAPRGDERPLDLAGVPDEEGIEPGDAAERVDKDPDEQGWDQDREEPDVLVQDVELPDDPPHPDDIRSRT